MQIKNEQDFLNQIKEVELEQKEAREQISYCKKTLNEAESRLIAANIRLSKLNEELYEYLCNYPKYEESQREKDIRLFRERLPDLLKRV